MPNAAVELGAALQNQQFVSISRLYNGNIV